MVTSKKVILGISAFGGVLLFDSIYHGTKAFEYYDGIMKKGGFESADELMTFHKKFSHIGYFPFKIIPSIFYGMNEIVLDDGECLIRFPKIRTNEKYMETMVRLNKEAYEKYVKTEIVE